MVNTPGLAVVCLRPPDGSAPVADIVAGVLKTGLVWVSAARFTGCDVIRACITHGETTEADVAVAALALDSHRTV